MKKTSFFRKIIMGVGNEFNKLDSKSCFDPKGQCVSEQLETLPRLGTLPKGGMFTAHPPFQHRLSERLLHRVQFPIKLQSCI